MSRWTEPGLEPEERAHAAVWHVRQNYQTTSVNEAIDIVTAALHAAVEQERRRCEGIAKEVGATMPPWPTSTKVAAEIATRIAGETKGGDEMRKVVRDDKVAVLYSAGYGAGWFTWNSDHPECLFDPEIVALVEQGQHDKIAETAEQKWGEFFYAGGAYGLRIKWLPVGTSFRITEYDGAESVETRDSIDWHTA